MSEKIPFVSNVQAYSIQDGPGIRTTVFLKGCPLQCKWCHNPENINPYLEVYYRNIKCTQCGKCLEVCSDGAIFPPIPIQEARQKDSGYQKINRDLCTRCMKCVEVCPSEALTIAGEEWELEQLLEEVRKDIMFYLDSGGGMTISGGEPTMFTDFSIELLKGSKEWGIDTCVDTTAYCKWENLEKLLPYTTLFLLDIKHMNSQKHKKGTGVSNELIIENAKKLAESGATIRIRIPIVPGFNDTKEELEEIAKFAKSLGSAVQGVDLLPFHDYCVGKYEQLDRVWSFPESVAMDAKAVAHFKELFDGYGLDTTIGG